MAAAAASTRRPRLGIGGGKCPAAAVRGAGRRWDTTMDGGPMREESLTAAVVRRSAGGAGRRSGGGAESWRGFGAVLDAPLDASLFRRIHLD
jgi:hypothetical protein